MLDHSFSEILLAVYVSIPWAIIMLTYTFIFIDYFYGIIVSIIIKEATSRKMVKGLQKKVFVLFVPVLGILAKAFFVLCDFPRTWAATSQINDFLGVVNLADFPICLLFCIAIIFMECYSFLENSAKIDPRARNILAHFNHQLAEKLKKHHIELEDDKDDNEDLAKAS